MTPSEQLARELDDIVARGHRLFRSAGRGGETAVDLLDELMGDLSRITRRLRPSPKSPAALVVPEGRFTAGPIVVAGRVVRVETRRRRAA